MTPGKPVIGIAGSIVCLLLGGTIAYFAATQRFGVAAQYARESITLAPGTPDVSCPSIARGQRVELWPVAESGGVERVRLVDPNCVAARIQFSPESRPLLNAEPSRVLRWAYRPTPKNSRSRWLGMRYSKINIRWEPDPGQSNVIKVLDGVDEIEMALGTVTGANGEDWLEVRLVTGEIGYITRKFAETSPLEEH